MILPDIILTYRQNKIRYQTGTDRLDRVKDKQHFQSYPYAVEYRYNSRGFRDTEWPNTVEELKQAVWCVGDSSTVGIGSPVEHTWPYQVGQHLGKRSINVSLDGASNDWIARKSQRIIDIIGPDFLIVQWSFIRRREDDLDRICQERWQKFYKDIADPTWPTCHWTEMDNLSPEILKEINEVFGGWNKDQVGDQDLRIESIDSSPEQDVEHTAKLANSLNHNCGPTKVIHSFVPEFAPIEHAKNLESRISGLVIPEFTPLDFARDGNHYDILTAQQFATSVQELVNKNCGS